MYVCVCVCQTHSSAILSKVFRSTVFFGDDSLHRARQRSITRASGEVVVETVAALSLAD